MARLENNIYESLSIQDIKDPIIFVVDMVKGFVNEGPLHDEAINDITDNIKNLMEALACKKVFVCDTHPPRTREFNSFPAHCVIGTSEAEVIDELKPYIQWLIHKNSTNTFVAPEFQEFLKESMSYYKDIIITGCCTDLCILQFVLGLNSYLNEHNMVEYRIIVPVNCTETYDSPVHSATYWNDAALQNMAMNGVFIVKEIK